MNWAITLERLLSIGTSIVRAGLLGVLIALVWSESPASGIPPHGTPISWLAQYGLTNDPAQAELMDLDGDGAPNWHEYQAGTDPTNQASVFKIVRAARSINDIRIWLSTVSQKTCRVESSADLKIWNMVQSNILGDGGAVEVVDAPGIAKNEKRFYRAAMDGIPGQPQFGNMKWVEPGVFVMGSPSTEFERYENEGPQTTVTLTHGFWIGKFEVTQQEYREIMNDSPSHFAGDGLPVEQVSWDDAVSYCVKLTDRERDAGRLPAGYVYRLPTEAEWEYCCRAGKPTPFGVGDGNGLSSFQANFNGEVPYGGAPFGPFLSKTTPVSSYWPNDWDLYDMHGNVWEWCLDGYGSYPGGDQADWFQPNTGSSHVVRSGGWNSVGLLCRSAFRGEIKTDVRSNRLGFRVVLGVPIIAP